MEETNQTRRKLQTAASTRKKGGESETAHNRLGENDSVGVARTGRTV